MRVSKWNEWVWLTRHDETGALERDKEKMAYQEVTLLQKVLTKFRCNNKSGKSKK